VLDTILFPQLFRVYCIFCIFTYENKKSF